MRAGEIDVMEGQGSEPDVFYGTIHSNTNGCSPADDQNGNNYRYVATNLTAGFHTYAVKWTPTQVRYLDGRRAHSAETYPADNQPMFVLLQMWSGSWTKDPDATTPDMLEAQADWVRVCAEVPLAHASETRLLRLVTLASWDSESASIRAVVARGMPGSLPSKPCLTGSGSTMVKPYGAISCASRVNRPLLLTTG
jgi:beta-glucanase (GH16 family)